MRLIEKILTNNPCYTSGRKITVQGLMLHSVGCPQPSAMVFINNWNRASYGNACVHGFIDANDGTAYQTLPWNHRGWHCASGNRGSGNNTHIGVEMCEPACIKYTGGSNFTCSDLATARAAATRTYNTAVELFAMLCKKYNLNPLKDGVIISHREGHARGIASNHGDPEHLWRGLGLSYTMDTFRAAVNAAMKGGTVETPTVDKGMQASALKNLTEAQVVAKVGTLFTADQKKSGILACVSMAQFILESGYGHTDLAQNANNCFGMKKSLSGNTWSGSTWDGKSIYIKKTKEQKKDGTEYTITADFRKYPNMTDSIGDHSAYLLGAMNGSKKRYEGLKGCTDYKKAAQIIKDGGYATDVTYVAKLCNIIERWNLTQYNASASQTVTPVEQNTLPAVPFMVEVIVSDLNYRSTGSNDGTIKGQTGKGIFTIVEIKSGWGRLKSGAGWIYLLNPAYCKVKGATTSTPVKSKFPYPVRVLVSDLNIRKGAGIDNASVGYTGKGTFTIVDEKQGVIDRKGTIGTWGKLKSGAGWICLAYKEYTQKV